MIVRTAVLSILFVEMTFALFISPFRENNIPEMLVTNKCLACICHALSDCDLTLKCRPEITYGEECGVFKIPYSQWLHLDEFEIIDHLKGPGAPKVDPQRGKTPYQALDDYNRFVKCAEDPICSADFLDVWLTFNQRDCNGDKVIDCFDFATIKEYGRRGCPAVYYGAPPTAFWKKFEECTALLDEMGIDEDNKIF